MAEKRAALWLSFPALVAQPTAKNTIPAIAAQGTTIVAVQTANLVKSILPLGNSSKS